MYRLFAFAKGGPDLWIDYRSQTSSGGLTPPAVGSSEWIRQVEESIDVREKTERNVWPSEFLAAYHPGAYFDPDIIPEPLRMRGIEDAQSAAAWVGMDKPWHLAEACLDWTHDMGVPLRERAIGVQFHGSVGEPMRAVINRIDYNLTRVFDAKYHFMYPRLEEILDIPGSIFTAYHEGCPCHPSYPAGHAGTAAAAQALNAFFDYEPWQWQVIYDAMYHGAQYRTLAGVHLPMDNIDGLRLSGVSI